MGNATLKLGKLFTDIPFERKLSALNYHDAQFVILTAKNAFGKCLLQVAFHIFHSISSCIVHVKVKFIPQQAEVAQGVLGRLRPRIFLTFGTTRVVGRNPWYSFSGTESTPGHMVPSGEPQKKSPVTSPGIFFFDPGTV